MGRINIPASPRVTSLSIHTFLGADLTGSPGYISPYRSPDCPNMIRESAGKVRKWAGWRTVASYEGRINGFHSFSLGEEKIRLVHAGTCLYAEGKKVCRDMADSLSVSRQLAGKLVIADGKTLMLFYKEDGDFVCKAASLCAYVPTVTISRSPEGGGTPYEAVNLLGKARKDSFLSGAADRVFRLSANNIDRVTKVEKLKRDGEYEEITCFETDLVSGKVTLSAPVGESPFTGHDNLIITYEKEVPEYADRINGCDVLTLYGVNGGRDRIFAAGGSLFPNRDFYCEMDNPCYWPDLSYCTVGPDTGRITGYSLINEKLVTHVKNGENGANIILRTGSLTEDGRAAFTLAGTFRGDGAISKYAFANVGAEPLFLSAAGVMAVTPSDVLGERSARLRSYYLNGLLLKFDLSRAPAAVYDRFYMVSAGGYLFALDTTQTSVEKNAPYSARQYEGYYRENVDARCLADIDGVLTFGTRQGQVRRFYTDYSDPSSFNDDGKAIPARWSTPEIAGKHFYYKKRFRLVSVMTGSAVATSVRIKAVYDGISELLADYDSRARYLSFSHITFSKFTFKTDRAGRIFREKISIKPDDRKAGFIFENDVLNEPLALYEATVEFTESR